MSNDLSSITLEQLQAQVELLQATLAQQQAEIAALKAGPIEIGEGQSLIQLTSRRQALKRLLVVGAGAATVGTALLAGSGKVEAANGSTPNIGAFAFPGPNATPTNLPNKAGLAGSTDSDFGNTDVALVGVYGFSNTEVGVRGKSNSGSGVVGSSQTRTGVQGVSTSSFGVRGVSTESDGVSGFSNAGNGVSGFSTSGVGVSATSTNFTAMIAATFGNEVSIGLLATSTQGKAVYGRSSLNYGGVFRGGKAPLRLEPGDIVGHPTTDAHEVGEFFVDKDGKLFYCAVAGTPGRWKLLSPEL